MGWIYLGDLVNGFKVRSIVMREDTFDTRACIEEARELC